MENSFSRRCVKAKKITKNVRFELNVVKLCKA